MLILTLKRMFSRRWIVATFLVVMGAAFCARLGVWQLDRLENRRAFNGRVLAQVEQPELLLIGDNLGKNLVDMEYRKVVVVGTYDHSQEVALRNQAMDNQWGVHLITPLHIQSTNLTVLVDRGWIPAEEYLSNQWSEFSEPGSVTVHGVLRRSQNQPDFGKRKDVIPASGEGRLAAWNFVNVEGISQQTPYPLLPVYIQQSPEPGRQGLPARTQPTLDLTEGPHQGYAIQWFTFASILLIGYPFFIHRQEKLSKRTIGAGQSISVKPALNR